MVVARRREHLRRLEEELAADYRRRLLGRRLDVLVEGSDPHKVRPRPRHFLPGGPGYLSRICASPAAAVRPGPGGGDSRGCIAR